MKMTNGVQVVEVKDFAVGIFKDAGYKECKNIVNEVKEPITEEKVVESQKQVKATRTRK